MNGIDTNTLIAICACAIGLTQFILWKHIAKVKAYEQEKGKNLATKEDIAEITKEIESVKDIYNKALEIHKIELQKEFETSKYIIGLCNSLDDQLVKLVSNFIKIYSSEEPCINSEYAKNLVSASIDIYIFLEAYSVRYICNPKIESLYYIARRIKNNYDNNKYIENIMPANDQVDLFNAASNVLALFLPKLR